MPSWEQLKKTLEWAQLTTFVADVISSILSWKVVKKLLSYVPHVSEDWAIIISWSVAAFVLFALLWWQQRRKLGQNQSTQNATTNLIAPSTTFDAATFFKNAYNSALYKEIEDNFRAAAAQNQPNDREGFYLKIIAAGIIGYAFDIVWAYIFKSQILLMTELNRRALSLAEVRTYYDKAASDNPERYAAYSFDQWMEFMKSHVLLTHLPNGLVAITERGKDFLKYLLHWGRSADQRLY